MVRNVIWQDNFLQWRGDTVGCSVCFEKWRSSCSARRLDGRSHLPPIDQNCPTVAVANFETVAGLLRRELRAWPRSKHWCGEVSDS